jgi:hypothetical protein
VTDFIKELEAELLDAARRRAATGRRRWRPAARPRRLVAVALAAAGVLVIVVAVRAFDGPRDDRAVAPPAEGVEVILPAAVPATACEEREQRVETHAESPLSVFARPRTADDALPRPGGNWLPAVIIRPGDSRRAGDAHLVVADGLRTDGACVSSAMHRDGSGVCVVVDDLVRCFDDATIAAGRAVALTGDGRVHGIVPDGVRRLKLEWDGGTADADVTDNVYEASAPGLSEGDAVRVLVQRPEAGCAPSRELLDAFAALRSQGGGDPPPGVVEVMTAAGAREAWRRWARRAIVDGSLELWVAPYLPCDSDRAQVEEACVVAVRPGEEPRSLCARPEEGSWMVLPGKGGLVLAGLATPTTAFLLANRPGVRHGEMMTPVGGLFGGVLPERFGREPDPINVLQLNADPIAVLDATRHEGLAAEVAARLPRAEVTGSHPQRERSRVFFAGEPARPLADHVAYLLGIAAEPQVAPPGFFERAGEAIVAVMVGDDMRSR